MPRHVGRVSGVSADRPVPAGPRRSMAPQLPGHTFVRSPLGSGPPEGLPPSPQWPHSLCTCLNQAGLQLDSCVHRALECRQHVVLAEPLVRCGFITGTFAGRMTLGSRTTLAMRHLDSSAAPGGARILREDNIGRLLCAVCPRCCGCLVVSRCLDL